MRTRFLPGLAAALAAALLVAGCAEMGIGVNRPATQEAVTTATATVERIDHSTRDVTLRDDANGTSFTVTAGPEVRNLEQVKAGDHVQIQFYQATTVSMADPADTGEAATSIIAGRAPEGAMPGGAAAITDSMVVTVVTYDKSSGLATFRTPDGFTRQAVVPPNLRRFAETRGPGSRVLVSMTRAVAVSVTEAAAS
jgi:Cu/Ag efflux protein CusF